MIHPDDFFLPMLPDEHGNPFRCSVENQDGSLIRHRFILKCDQFRASANFTVGKGFAMEDENIRQLSFPSSEFPGVRVQGTPMGHYTNAPLWEVSDDLIDGFDLNQGIVKFRRPMGLLEILNKRFDNRPITDYRNKLARDRSEE